MAFNKVDPEDVKRLLLIFLKEKLQRKINKELAVKASSSVGKLSHTAHRHNKDEESAGNKLDYPYYSAVSSMGLPLEPSRGVPLRQVPPPSREYQRFWWQTDGPYEPYLRAVSPGSRCIVDSQLRDYPPREYHGREGKIKGRSRHGIPPYERRGPQYPPEVFYRGPIGPPFEPPCNPHHRYPPHTDHHYTRCY
ncbi:hypothetical protein Ciccas_004590 [Cichlidogyrus casuarinus]|uniref:Uncharacterized protein n=1 Tax=Cichlidogyrus casuarinus TaxID=1844966 RepID=A0ABD2QB22_9PLAT